MNAAQQTYWHDDESKHPPVGTWMWHVHHEILAEPLTDPLADRLRFIRTRKDPKEVPTRLALIHRVDLSLLDAKAYAAWTKADAALTKADAAWTKAYAAWTKAYAAWTKADAAWTKAYAARIKADAARTKAYAARIKAYAALRPFLEAIHATSCPGLSGVGTCPWNGRTIFPRVP